MVAKETCPYCGAEVVCKDSAVIYGTSYGKVLICSKWPKCDAYVGCQKGTNKPLGRLANPELRFWKKQAHSKFDKLWQHGDMSRNDAYAWLSRELSIPSSKCHIGMFDVDQCKAVCNAIKARITNGKE
jgi:hypothetical protein